MGRTVAQKLIESHRVGGSLVPGEEVALAVDQTLTQDATGTTVMLELEARWRRGGGGRHRGPGHRPRPPREEARRILLTPAAARA